LPGVASVGVIENILLNPLSQNSEGINVDGFQPPKGETSFDIDYTTADSGFFDAAGIRLLSGRLFNASDTPTAQRVAVINEVMAHMFWPGQDAVGRTFRDGKDVYRIIGVTRTTKVRTLGEPPRPFIFGAFSPSSSAAFMLVARVGPREDAAKTSIRMLAMLHDIDPALMIIQVKTMEQHLGAMLLPARLGAVSFAVFAGLALVLAIIGIYGVARYAVARRSREVAIRLAIGARPASLVRLLMRQGIVLVSMGAAIGLGLGLVASRALQSLLYGVTAVDPITFVGAPLALIAVGALAAFLPAWRASRVDPARTLRAE
ncbi:MAG TPA: FtsX-like permease family protein, partial [Gemmatimonadaceae bacterium]